MVIPEGLHPGRSSTGDLSDNLYDDDGKLAARAPLYYDEEEDDEEEGGDSGADAWERALYAAFTLIAVYVAKKSYYKYQPKVSAWWHKRRQHSEVKEPRAGGSERSSAVGANVEMVAGSEIESSSGQLVVMTAEEALGRIIDAAKARAYSDLQIEYVANASIVGRNESGNLAEVLRAAPTQEQLLELVNDLAQKPQVLSWSGFIKVASLVDEPHRELLDPAVRQLLSD